MKKTTLTMLAAAGCAALLTGCPAPGFTTIGESFPTEAAPETMTLAEASKIVSGTFADVPAGRRPSHPGDRALGRHTTSIRFRKDNRNGLVLVELKLRRKVIMEFYVRTPEDADDFAAAVWRLRQEYRDK